MIRIAAALTCAISLAACGEPQQPPVIPPVPIPEPQPAPISTPAPEPAMSGGYAAVPEVGEELPTSQTTPGPIPLGFRHVWAISAKDCTADPALTRIAIAPGAIRFYEGRSVVTRSDAATDGALTLEVEHASEGTTSSETHVLRLHEGERTLSYQRLGETFTYVRCD
jgi:hypothetical protein